MLDNASTSPPTIGSPPQPSLSCLECRRLKRKCDRLKPCNQCTKHSKDCVFPSSRQPRLSHRPHVDRSTSRDAPSERNHEQRGSTIQNSSARLPIPRPDSHHGYTSSSSLDISKPSSSQFTLPSPANIASSSGTGLGRITTPHLNGLPALASAASARRPSFALNPIGSSPLDSATTETLERQPLLASGYEWDERLHSVNRGQDGTACLSVEPDGDGYLGFASGATLLRILQIIAGGVLLPQQAPTRMISMPYLSQPWQPTEIQILDYVNAYFSSYHMQYPIIHEPTFRAQFQELMPKPPPSSWDILSNVVIGLGAFCCGQPMYVVDYFLESATSGISATQLESGSLTLVQSFTLLSNLAQKRNKVNSGSVYLGIALRMAIGLGLHRELPLWSISPFEREVRRRAWWVVYTFDAGAAITFGRPILLPGAEADVHPVRNVWDRSFPPSSKSPPGPIDEPTVYSSLLHQSSFHVLGNKCYNRTISSPAPSANEALAMDEELQQWHHQLPPYLRTDQITAPDASPWLTFSAQKLFWRYNNLRIIVGRRSFLERALKTFNMSAMDDSDSRSASICLTAALETISAISHFCSTHVSNRLEKWYQLHFLFHASFVPLIALHTDTVSPQRTLWSGAVDQALGVLRALDEEPLAQRCLQVVELLDPRRPFDGQVNDTLTWTDLIQMDLLGDTNGGVGGPAETLFCNTRFALAN